MTAKVSKKNSFSTLSYQVLWLGSGIRLPRTIPLGPRKFNVADLLSRLPVSRRLLEIRFRKVTGTTLHTYIIRRRIERFAHRLLSSVEPVKEVALDMEFDNYGNLVRLFKTYMGCTPTEYRERHRDMR